jgi:phosphatidylserine/phosphatidylglycerophosphate/cardiolipin synthase-like enzyme
MVTRKRNIQGPCVGRTSATEGTRPCLRTAFVSAQCAIIREPVADSARIHEARWRLETPDAHNHPEVMIENLPSIEGRVSRAILGYAAEALEV